MHSHLYNAIEAQDIELNARLRQVDIATRRMTVDVSLIRALGGGCQRKDELAPGTATATD
jgi:outer membrane protein, multidrug efflux system